MIGFTPVMAKELIGEVDNSSYPAISVKIHMTVVTPATAQGPGAGADDVWAAPDFPTPTSRAARNCDGSTRR